MERGKLANTSFRRTFLGKILSNLDFGHARTWYYVTEIALGLVKTRLSSMPTITTTMAGWALTRMEKPTLFIENDKILQLQPTRPSFPTELLSIFNILNTT